MSIRKYLPCDALTPWVAGFEIIESQETSAPYSILPDLNPVMGFQYQGRMLVLENQKGTLLETAGVTGIQLQPRQYQNLPHTGTVLVRFHPWGAAAFLSVPMRDFAQANVGLDALLSRTLMQEITEKLQESQGDSGRIRVVESFLLSLLRTRVRTPDGAVRHAVRLLQSDDGNMTVEGLASWLGLSDRQLERKFQEWIGIGPKRFARLSRFQSVLRKMNVPSQLARTDFESGYYDQAHFIKDFRSFSGTTPEAFVRRLRETQR